MNIYIQTLGCPKNINDSQVVAGILEEAGHQIVGEAADADALLLNTCGFIEDAKTESIAEMFRLSQMGKTLIVTGCLIQRYGEEMYKEVPEVDIFLGVNDYEKVPEILKNHQEGQREKYLSPYEKELETTTRKLGEIKHTATIKIAEGCDNHCTYCIIPAIRGPYRSRPMEAIVEEAQKLANQGTKEIILIAQDTSAWGIDLYGEYRLPALLHQLGQVEGIEWIRILYCYEERITDQLIQAMAEEPKVCHYIDIPLQHGSDKVLREMARQSTNASIYSIIKRLKTAMPDIHIRTTFITGFPGETEEDFAKLEEMVEDIAFERLGVFAYSAEEDTPAAKRPDQIDQEIKEARRDAIMRRQMDISLAHNQEKIGKTMKVLLDQQQEDGSWLGRTQYDAPEIDCAVIVTTAKNHQPGDMILVLVEDAYDYDLVGREKGDNENELTE